MVHLKFYNYQKVKIFLYWIIITYLFLVSPQNGVVETIGDQHDNLRQRKPKKETEKNDKNTKKRLKFILKPSDSIQTDFNGPEALCRVVRVHPNGKLMATGDYGTFHLKRV